MLLGKVQLMLSLLFIQMLAVGARVEGVACSSRARRPTTRRCQLRAAPARPKHSPMAPRCQVALAARGVLGAWGVLTLPTPLTCPPALAPALAQARVLPRLACQLGLPWGCHPTEE